MENRNKMTLEDFKHKLRTTPETIQFSDTMNVIEANYDFIPTAFINGELSNSSEENLGSCKLLGFARLQGFSREETLACFGQFYFEDVLKDPNGYGHQNIRNFIKTGFDGLSFEVTPLIKK